MRHASASDRDSLRCSFCHKAQGAVRKLISNPGEYPRAYICDECVGVCMTIIEDEREDTSELLSNESDGPHPLLSHPLASELMDCVTQWIRKESLGHPVSEEFARLRDVASRIVAGR
ncbi:MAG: ClpX C4-type zinc finger protein [Bryobacteraceae bacterium]